MREFILTKIRLYSLKGINTISFFITCVLLFFFNNDLFNPIIAFPITFLIIRGLLQISSMMIYFFSFNIPFKIEKIEENGLLYCVKHYNNYDVRWYYQDKLHRENGKPAVLNSNVGIKKFFFNGKEVVKKDTFTLSNKRKIGAF